jgi:phosphomannomutase/phosphoglucomutase
LVAEHIFREYDIRGVAERDLTPSVVERIGRGLADMLRSGPGPLRLAVARDCRSSGPRLFENLTRGLRAGGADVLDVGVGPTPLMYFAVHHLQTDGGVMITGSHNPGDENGFKIMRGKQSFFGEDIQRLRELVQQASFEPASKPGTLETLSVEAAYLDRLRASVRITNTDFGVVVDAGNGSAGPLGLKALHSLGFDPTALYCDMDGSFPNHHPDPTVPENLETLIATVRARGARVGIAWDGDGDRLGVVDATGEIIWGDRLLSLFARDVLRDNPGAAVVADVKCSDVLFDDVTRAGGRAIMWKTGHSLIKTKVKAEGALLAGEMSGHLFFADRYLGYDDAIYAALRLLEILAREGKGVGELLQDLPKRFATPELRLACPDAIKFEVVAGVKQELELQHDGELNVIDGVRVRYADGAWALVRASNTGPVLVLRIEAPSQARGDALRAAVEACVLRVQQRLGFSG